VSKPVRYSVDVESRDDTEIDAIALCIEVLKRVPEANAKARVVEYLFDRFGTRIVNVSELSK
jgi:cytochrome c-type biogenesis protein CcmH/NrfF